MFNTLTDYNEHKNMPLSNTRIQEVIRKFIEEESIDNPSNITAETFGRTSNTQR